MSSPRTPGTEQPESPNEHGLKRAMKDPGEASFRPNKRVAGATGGEYIRQAMSARKLSPSRTVGGMSPGPLSSEQGATPPAAQQAGKTSSQAAGKSPTGASSPPKKRSAYIKKITLENVEFDGDRIQNQKPASNLGSKSNVYSPLGASGTGKNL